MILTGSAIMAACTIWIFLPGLPDMARVALCLGFSFFGGLLPPSGEDHGNAQLVPWRVLVSSGARSSLAARRQADSVTMDRCHEPSPQQLPAQLHSSP